MASLVDPVSEDVRALLCQIADPWTKSTRWPVWQYVRGCLDEAGIDADRVWREMPTWDRNYRAAQALDSFGSQTPLDEQRVALSVHGWVHSGHESSDYVIRLFLSAIQLGHQAQRSAPLDPDHVRDVQLDGPRFFAQADQALDGKPTGGRDVLPHVLSMEPPTWGSLSVSRESDSSFPDAWTWGVTRLSIRFPTFLNGDPDVEYTDGQTRNVYLYLPDGDVLRLVDKHWTPQTYESVLTQAGFVDVDITERAADIPDDSGSITRDRPPFIQLTATRPEA